jgi:hypothetical protein
MIDSSKGFQNRNAQQPAKTPRLLPQFPEHFHFSERLTFRKAKWADGKVLPMQGNDDDTNGWIGDPFAVPYISSLRTNLNVGNLVETAAPPPQEWPQARPSEVRSALKVHFEVIDCHEREQTNQG